MTQDTALVEQKNTTWNEDQVRLIKNTVAKGATDDELQMFINICRQTGLDPFSRQIHFVKRKQKIQGQYQDVATIQTGIDGYRLIADRTGQYDGQKTFWCGTDGTWREVWTSEGHPFAAMVRVYRKGCSQPFEGIARWKAYVQTNQEGQPVFMWAKMDAEQLAKCAEALALRKAFPQELSKVYTNEEMAQADVMTQDKPRTIVNQAKTEQAPTTEQSPERNAKIKDCREKAKALSKLGRGDVISNILNGRSLDSMTEDEIDHVYSEMLKESQRIMDEAPKDVEDKKVK